MAEDAPHPTPVRYLAYDKASGHVIASKTTIVEPVATDLIGYVVSDLPAPDVWVDAGEAVTDRQAVTIFADRAAVIPDGSDAVTITLPDPCWLSIDGQRVLAEGGGYAFTTELAGEHMIEAAGRWRSNVLIVEAKGLEPVRYSRLEWFSRFTLAEHGAVIASTDPIVRAIYDRTMAAEFIDPADPRTTEGLNYLVSVGIITAERASVITEGQSE